MLRCLVSWRIDFDNRESSKMKGCMHDLVFPCKEAGENVDHILLHCKLATRLWGIIFSWLGVLG